MRSTITRSLAAVTLGAALTLAPVGVAFADGHIAPAPDVELPGDPELNQPETFEAWLLENYDIVATCQKLETVDTPFVVPGQPSEDEEWSFLVIKAGADASVEYPNEGWFYPQPGWELEHSSGKDISHVIVCTSDVEDEETTTSTTTTTTSTTTTSTTTTPVTGPVVETDRPVGGDYGQLGLFAGAAVALAAAGGLALNRRRQSAEH
jgi:hypothetical protein